MARKIFHFGILLVSFLIPATHSLGGNNDGVGIAGVHGIGVFPEAASTTAVASSLTISADTAPEVSTAPTPATMATPPCKFPLVTLSPLTAEDFSLVSVPATECLQAPLDTTTLPLTCSEPSSIISWVTEGKASSSRVLVVGCFPASTTSSATAAPSTATWPATSVTIPCAQPDVHTSATTLADGSVTSIEVAVCGNRARPSAGGTPPATGTPSPPDSSTVRKTTVMATTTTTVRAAAPTTTVPRGSCKLLGTLHSWLTLENSSVVVTRITTCLNFVTAAATPASGLDGNAQLVAELHAGHTAGAPSAYGALPGALTSFLGPPTDTTLVVDTSSPPSPYPPGGTTGPLSGGAGSSVGGSAALSSAGSLSEAGAGTSFGSSAPASTSEAVSAARTTRHGGVSATPTTPAATTAAPSSGAAGLAYGHALTAGDCLAALCLVAGAYLVLV